MMAWRATSSSATWNTCSLTQVSPWVPGSLVLQSLSPKDPDSRDQRPRDRGPRDQGPRDQGPRDTEMPVPDVDRFRPEDRRAVEALYRRVFGTDAAEASRLRWEWQYRRNPNNPGGEPEIWIAREGPAIIGQYAEMPVKLAGKRR